MAIPKTLNQLRSKILYEWNNLPENYVFSVCDINETSCLVVVKSVRDIPTDIDAAAGFNLRIL